MMGNAWRLAVCAAVTGSADTSGMFTATEAAEVLNSAQAGLQEVAENPGLIRTWLEGLVPDVLNFALQVLVAVLVYFVGSKLIGWILKLTRRSMERAGTDEGVKQFVIPLAKYALYVVLIFIIMGLFGIATTSAVAVLGSAGVAIGLALQGSLSNFAGGVLILLLKPFRVGEYIVEDSNKNEGTVSEISIFYTKLLTPDNRVVVIPNGTLSNSSLTNVSHMDKRKLELTVGISYDSDIRKAKEVLNAVVEKEPARLQGEEVIVAVDSLGDSSVNMAIKFWVATSDYWPARWRMMENIKYALDENGIAIPFPQMDVQLKK